MDVTSEEDILQSGQAEENGKELQVGPGALDEGTELEPAVGEGEMKEGDMNTKPLESSSTSEIDQTEKEKVSAEAEMEEIKEQEESLDEDANVEKNKEINENIEENKEISEIITEKVAGNSSSDVTNVDSTENVSEPNTSKAPMDNSSNMERIPEPVTETKSTKEASDEKSDSPCSSFNLDVKAEFGYCTCGHKKVEHSAEALDKSGKNMVSSLAKSKIMMMKSVKVDCTAYVIDMSAETFGTCKCGYPKARHSQEALETRKTSSRANSKLLSSRFDAKEKEEKPPPVPNKLKQQNESYKSARDQYYGQDGLKASKDSGSSIWVGGAKTLEKQSSIGARDYYLKHGNGSSSQDMSLWTSGRLNANESSKSIKVTEQPPQENRKHNYTEVNAGRGAGTNTLLLQELNNKLGIKPKEIPIETEDSDVAQPQLMEEANDNKVGDNETNNDESNQGLDDIEDTEQDEVSNIVEDIEEEESSKIQNVISEDVDKTASAEDVVAENVSEDNTQDSEGAETSDNAGKESTLVNETVEQESPQPLEIKESETNDNETGIPENELIEKPDVNECDKESSDSESVNETDETVEKVPIGDENEQETTKPDNPPLETTDEVDNEHELDYSDAFKNEVEVNMESPQKEIDEQKSPEEKSHEQEVREPEPQPPTDDVVSRSGTVTKEAVSEPEPPKINSQNKPAEKQKKKLSFWQRLLRTLTCSNHAEAT